MATLKFPNEGPPRGWIFTEYRTGLQIKGDNLWTLVDEVIKHRQHRGLSGTDRVAVRLEVERQICSRLGSSHCKSEGAGDTWKPVEDLTLSLGLSHIMAASKAMLEWLSTGMGMAPMDEAQRRRAICSTCQMNQHAVGCKCDILYKMINSAVPADRQFGDLNICGACGCSLKAKVSAPANVITASEKGRNLTYPAHCWVPALTEGK